MNTTQTDLTRFNGWALMIERDSRTTDNEKMILKLKAWAYCATLTSFFSLMVELPRVY